MKIASVADVKAHLSAYIKASEGELVVITKNGKPVAVLLPMEDDEELEWLALAYSQRFQTILREAREQFQAGAGVSHADFGVGPKLKPINRSLCRIIQIATRKDGNGATTTS